MPAAADDIHDLLRARRRALLDGDADGLAALLTPGYRYVDSLGRLLSRAAYLESRRSGEVTFDEHELDDITLADLTPGRSVLVTCRARDRARFRGEPFEAEYRAMHVVVRAGPVWLFEYGQSTAIART